ncbi:proline-serine-threonine phosphatase-interacting protein 2-like isoform X2 [Mercenaria mercenaria]|nr:proline-serine-threonine phosphatase-interacting protein 2-like isoform X2 [Mercenaria mercenaria]
MKEGRKVCTEVAHYLKDRAKAEADYSKALQNLARKADGKEETGVLGESWRNLKAQTERIASVHEEASSLFSSYMEEVTKFNEEQTRVKKQTEENVKKYIQSKKNEFQKTMSLKKTYEDKCKDFNNAEETLKTAKSSVTTKKNELEKAESKVNKAKDNRENADMAYRSSVDNLESTRSTWERETIQGCNQFEDLEVKRIEYLRDLLWRITNVDSTVCLNHDNCSESVRNILENCDVATDIQDFIENNKSGSKKPDPVLYENYYNGKALPPSRPPAGLPLALPKQAPARPPVKPPSPTRPPPRPNLPDDGLYATVDPAANTNSKNKAIYLQVVREHQKTNSVSVSELAVSVGDILEYIGETHVPGMVKVKNNNRLVGFIPKTCVKVYDPDTPLITF